MSSQHPFNPDLTKGVSQRGEPPVRTRCDWCDTFPSRLATPKGPQLCQTHLTEFRAQK